MQYKQLVQNKFGHIYYQFVEQKKISESVDAPTKLYCWYSEIVEKVK